MSRKYMNDKWRVRCGKKDPTPFLKEMYTKWPVAFKFLDYVVDIGCGNGRNSKFIRKHNPKAHIDSLDMCDDYGTKFNLGHDPFPSANYNLILANYILMFLDKNEQKQVMMNMDSCAAKNAIIIIEMYPAKDTYKYNFNKMINFFLDKGWIIIVKRKDKCMLWR